MDFNFSDSIVLWYIENKRDLPWRNTHDPYKIWVSEIILQQTRIAQGLSYYNRFVQRFPTIAQLAEASEDEVLILWQGLGYYSRARNMHAAAKNILEKHNGIFPSSYNEIRSLKGVGDYTAAAIASFAFNLPFATLDGNVFRLLSRYFAIDTPIDSCEGKKQFASLSQQLLNPAKAALHNQGMMDLGATVCLPSSPHCDECPVSSSCLAFSQNSQNEFPVKSKKTKQKERFFLYVKICDKGYTYLHRRSAKDIWKGLYEFPLIEWGEELTDEKLFDALATLLDQFQITTVNTVHASVAHQLSHQKILARLVEVEGSIRVGNSDFIKIRENQLGDFAVSRLTELLINSKSLNYSLSLHPIK